MNPCRFQPVQLIRIVRLRDLDDCAALVACGPEHLLEEGVGHVVDVVTRVDQQEVDGADVAAGADGRPEGEHRPTDQFASLFGHEDAGLRQVDQLAKEIRGDQRTRLAGRVEPTRATTRRADRRP